MFITEKSPKKYPYKAFIYPYILIIAFLGLLWIVNQIRDSQLQWIHFSSTIYQYQSRNLQQQCLTILEAVLKNHDLIMFQTWIEEHPAVYNDINGDGVTDSLFLLDQVGINGTAIDIVASHYLLKKAEWGVPSHPMVTIPLETNLNKSIHVLPNRYCLSPKIGLLYQFNRLSGNIVSCRKITIQHNIE